MSETFVIQVSVDGKITIPKAVRDALGINEGDLVRMSVEKVKEAQ